MDDTRSLLDLNLEELTRILGEMGEPSYRAEQIWNWLFKQLVNDFGDMTNLSQTLRDELKSSLTIPEERIVTTQQSSNQQTEKVLFELKDGNLLETVLMRYKKRRTLCISTQVGCAMGCVFCATGQMGFVRNLSVGEIVNQVLYYARRLKRNGNRVTNIVVMGMGEPFHNYDNTVAAIDILTAANGFDLGARRITISTVGLVPAIRRYADEGRQSSLAISLHATTDEERSELIPVNNRWPVADLMDAIRYYLLRSGRRITFEWALINEENDTKDQAKKLGNLLKGMLCHVNLIPLNPTKGYAGRPSSRSRVTAFQMELANYGISSSVRVRRGIDIQAGCGQLRDRVVSDKKGMLDI